MTIDDKLWRRLTTALANFDAAFPAGEYGFNPRQCRAVNAIGEITFDLAHSNEAFCRKLKNASFRYIEWQLEELVRKGIVSREAANASLNNIYGEYHDTKAKKKSTRK